MDKVKQQLAVVLKHGFWIGCALSALLAIAAWYQATSTLSEEAKKQKDTIKSKAGAVQSIINDTTPHPNDATLKGMDELNNVVALNVKEGWKKVYDLQREVLVWPDTFDAKFHRAVDNLRPIEIVPFPTPQEKEINPDFQRQYRDYILEVIPKLAKTVGTDWKAVRQASAGGASASMDYSAGFSGGGFAPPGVDMAMGKPVEDKSIVHWNPGNQQEIQNTHFGFAGRVEPPKTLEILYAQEDLWVLQTLVEIIASTNKGAEFYHESAIKDIDYIRIGRNAGGVSGWVTRIAATTTDASGMGMPMVIQPMDMSLMPMTGTGGAAVSIDPAENRYVDANFKPLKAAQVRSVVTNPQVGEAEAVLAVAKRMPVRMRVVMDQRKLPLLLSECANSRLPVEVKQVRINRPPGSAVAGSSNYGGGAPMSGPEGGMLSPFGGGGGAMSPYGSGQGQKGGGPDPHSITAELFGIIYIYNPPNDAQLGIQNTNQTAGGSGAPPNLVSR